METIVKRAAALDVHKAQVTACVRVPGRGGVRTQELAEFATTVRGLLGLRDWLKAHRVSQVAMEASGVYWKPVWAILETSSTACSSTLVMSSRCRAARLTSRMPPGSAGCSRQVCCGAASCRRSRSGRCAT